MNEHKIDVFEIGGCILKLTIMPADYLGVQETHDYEHASICVKGSGWLIREGENVPFKAGDILTVPAKVPHAIQTREPTEWLCVHRGE